MNSNQIGMLALALPVLAYTHDAVSIFKPSRRLASPWAWHSHRRRTAGDSAERC